MSVPNLARQITLVITCLFLPLCFVSADEPVLVQSMKIGGNVVNNVRVKEATPTYVVVTYDGGGSKLNRKNLPSELKALYPYDAKEAAAYEQQQAAEQAERNKRQKPNRTRPIASSRLSCNNSSRRPRTGLTNWRTSGPSLKRKWSR